MSYIFEYIISKKICFFIIKKVEKNHFIIFEFLIIPLNLLNIVFLGHLLL